MILKKWLLFLFILLCLFSIVKDLGDGSSSIDYTIDNLAPTSNSDEKGKNEFKTFQVVSYQVTTGDTFISIIDQLNESSSAWDLTQYIKDFKALNPKVDIKQLQPNTTYLFPHYLD